MEEFISAKYEKIAEIKADFEFILKKLKSAKNSNNDKIK